MQKSNNFENKLLTVSEIASALKVPLSWGYERTRQSGGNRRLGSWIEWPLI